MSALIRSRLFASKINVSCLFERQINKSIGSRLNLIVPRKAVVSQQLSNSTAPAAHDKHSHTGLWKIERIVSASLLGIIPTGLLFPNPVLDYALALALTLHIHWGLEAIVVDYIRPSIFGSVIPKASLGLVYLLSILTVGGLFYFNYTDVGVSHGIRLFLRM